MRSSPRWTTFHRCVGISHFVQSSSLVSTLHSSHVVAYLLHPTFQNLSSTSVWGFSVRVRECILTCLRI